MSHDVRKIALRARIEVLHEASEEEAVHYFNLRLARDCADPWAFADDLGNVGDAPLCWVKPVRANRGDFVGEWGFEVVLFQSDPFVTEDGLYPQLDDGEGLPFVVGTVLLRTIMALMAAGFAEDDVSRLAFHAYTYHTGVDEPVAFTEGGLL